MFELVVVQKGFWIPIDTLQNIFERDLSPGEGVLPYKGLMGTYGQPGYVFLDFCLKQGIDFITFCLNQCIDFINFCLKHGICAYVLRTKLQQNIYKLLVTMLIKL